MMHIVDLPRTELELIQSMANLAIEFCFLVLAILTPTLCLGAEEKHEKSIAMFVFGDSTLDPGNNNFLNTTHKANFVPYGETFFRYPTGRFSDGRLLIDFAASYAGLPYWKPYLDPHNHNFTIGANFASAGAGALIETQKGLVISLEVQLEYFKIVAKELEEELGEDDAKKVLNGAIYYIGIGGVDLLEFINIFPTYGSESEMQDYDAVVLGNITDTIKEIYKIGGRKFALQNIAPIGCIPSTKQTNNITTGCDEVLQTLATMHNEALNNVSMELASEFPGFKYLIFDYFNVLLERTKNPTKYGFVVGDVACCGSGTFRGENCGSLTVEYELCDDPSEYVFFDGNHPGEACNMQFIELLWNGTTDVVWPMNLKELIELDSEADVTSISNHDFLVDE